jgi:hypothetical protein
MEIELAKKEVIIKLQADSLMEANEHIRKLLEKISQQDERMAHQEHEVEELKVKLQQSQMLSHIRNSTPSSAANSPNKQEHSKETEKAKEEETSLRREERNNTTSIDDELIKKEEGDGTTGNQDEDDNFSSKESQNPSTPTTINQTPKANGETEEEDVEQLKSKIQTLESTVDRLENVIEELTAFINEGAVIQEAETDDNEDDDDDEGLINSSNETDLLPVGEGVGETILPQEQQAQAQPPTPKFCLPHGHKLLLLISSIPANATFGQNQRRLQTILQGYQLQENSLQLIDGCEPSLKTLRDDLFRISGHDGEEKIYPLLFLVSADDLSFVGDYETILELHDRQLLVDILGLIPL